MPTKIKQIRYKRLLLRYPQSSVPLMCRLRLLCGFLDQLSAQCGIQGHGRYLVSSNLDQVDTVNSISCHGVIAACNYQGSPMVMVS